VRAVCVRCGGERSRWDAVCPACGHRPDGEGLLVAWLLSSENLGAAELDGTRERIRAGHPIRPTARMLELARKATGRHFATDLGLPTRDRLALLAASLLLTPLPGFVLAAWWWNERPRAARQALALSLPAALVTTSWWVWAVT
jgi:hypothetical protein